ncbi:MAG: hypothetical protein J6X69_08040 [Bacteroidales bacterium]|nr:hypothetical protein [Bacteroidales bacterium]
MKYVITTILATFLFFSAAAQVVDTTSTEIGDKLNFEEPNFMTSNYFESVKAHPLAEGRKAWKPEFSVRGGATVHVGMFDLTGGIRTSPNKVFGLGVGRQAVWLDAYPGHAYMIDAYLYHRHYLPLDKRRRFSLYSDLMGGGSYVYRLAGNFDRDPAPMQVGAMRWFFSWQPGLSIRLWGKSNIFFGPTIGPSFGVHLGVAI